MSQEAIEYLSPGVPIDYQNCGREPIHLTERVQAIGCMLVIDAQSLIIEQCTQNTEIFFRVVPDNILGQAAENYIPGMYLKQFQGELQQIGDRRRYCGSIECASWNCHLYGHRSDAKIVIELIPISREERRIAVSSALNRLEYLLDQTENAENFESMCQTLADFCGKRPV